MEAQEKLQVSKRLLIFTLIGIGLGALISGIFLELNAIPVGVIIGGMVFLAVGFFSDLKRCAHLLKKE